MKCTFRHDSRPWAPPEGAKYVTPAEAAEAFAETGTEAAAARKRMLERMGLVPEDDGGAVEARSRMIQRESRRTGT